MTPKALDIIIVLFALFLTGFSAYAVYVNPQERARVLIGGQGQEWVFPLDAEETVEVPGPLGNTTIRIHGNEVWVERSPCVNQICVAQGRAHRQGAWAACLPNGVYFVIEGEKDSLNEVDAMAW